MNAREVEAKARLMFDEYGPEALNMTARRSETTGRSNGGPQAVAWRAVHLRVSELARQEKAAETAEIESEIREDRAGTWLGRLWPRLRSGPQAGLKRPA